MAKIKQNAAVSMLSQNANPEVESDSIVHDDVKPTTLTAMPL
jgi:hypothetical protein